MPIWIGAGASFGLAVIAGFGAWRRERRRDMDDVGFMPWQLIQVLALLVAFLLASLALNSS